MKWLLALIVPSKRNCRHGWHRWDYSKWVFPAMDNADDCLVNEVSKTCLACGIKVQMTGWNYPAVGAGDYSPRFTATGPSAPERNGGMM